MKDVLKKIIIIIIIIIIMTVPINFPEVVSRRDW